MAGRATTGDPRFTDLGFTLRVLCEVQAPTTGMGAGIITVVATKLGGIITLVDITTTATTTMDDTTMAAGTALDIIDPPEDTVLGNHVLRGFER